MILTCTDHNPVGCASYWLAFNIEEAPEELMTVASEAPDRLPARRAMTCHGGAKVIIFRSNSTRDTLW
jgi:hypothetical protein